MELAPARQPPESWHRGDAVGPWRFQRTCASRGYPDLLDALFLLTHHKQLADSLIQRLADASPAIRLNALKGLWQWWYWNDDVQLRGKIEDAFLVALAQSQHPWVARNLREGIYNIADDNIRYLYNNWIPLTRER